jgi:hypothetical protein
MKLRKERNLVILCRSTLKYDILNHAQLTLFVHETNAS